MVGQPHCGCCQALLAPEDDRIPRDLRIPCSRCNSQTRKFSAGSQISATASVEIALAKSWRGKRRRPSRMEKDGVGMCQRTGRATVDRISFDKGLNEYRHTVWDRETMEVIHDHPEPFLDHWGHGSAKPQRSKKPPLD
jgi:hypothetical protein